MTDFLGFSLRPFLSSCHLASSRKALESADSHIFYCGSRDSKKLQANLKKYLFPNQLEKIIESESEVFSALGRDGYIWVLRPSAQSSQDGEHYGLLEPSALARARDRAGSLVPGILQQDVKSLILHFVEATYEEQKGVLLGFEMAHYKYKNTQEPRPQAKRQLKITVDPTGCELQPVDVAAMASLGVATNLARHLVNVPGGALQPQTYAQNVQKLFAKRKNCRVEVWRGLRLQKEKMHLLQAVGQGAEQGPCMVHIRYRPTKAVNKQPLAFVGKGITFDSGGLDIKPSAGMRWMKKDMGGSASVVGLAYWLSEQKLPVSCDFYLAIAENAVDGKSFRPGDVVKSRNGKTIEIHNTDAEGRLVLADVLDVAIQQPKRDEPEAVIDLATLTGAIKVGLGADVAGLFCNRDELADSLLRACQKMGEPAWRMPLYRPYKAQLRSHFADHINSSDGFGGAVTAALFLEFFVGSRPWAHLDIYAWKDGPSGACTEVGGNGQFVQTLAAFLENRVTTTAS